MSLRKRMQGLVVAAVVPLAGLLAFNAFDAWRDLRRQARGEALNQALLTSGTMLAWIDGARDLAVAVAKRLSGVAIVSREECSEYLRSVLESVPRYHGIAILDPSGAPRCSNLTAPPELNVADRPYFREALASHDLVVGPLIKGRVTARYVLPLAMALRDGTGQITGVVLLTVKPEYLAMFLGKHFSTERGFIALFDRTGTMVARVPDHDSNVGRTASPIFQKFVDGEPTVVERADYRGREHFIGVIPVNYPPKGLLILVGIDRELAMAEVPKTVFRNLILAAGCIALAFFLAWLVGKRLIQRPIRQLVATARRQEAGELGARFPIDRPDTELGQLAQSLNSMAAALERLVQQKTLLIREVQHRVMNSLQLLSSFLHLQSRQISDESARKHLKEARERIVSMSVIYRHLYHSETASDIEFGHVLRLFCAETGKAYMGASGPDISVNADDVVLPMQAALNLALIAHEVITNALKHAYPDGKGGPLQVDLRHRNGNVELAVRDEGKGLPADFDVDSAPSLGMAVVQTLTRQLRGKLTIERLAKGTRFAIAFPLQIRTVSDRPADAYVAKLV
jgi:two-component sensor histidine kinase